MGKGHVNSRVIGFDRCFLLDNCLIESFSFLMQLTLVQDTFLRFPASIVFPQIARLSKKQILVVANLPVSFF